MLKKIKEKLKIITATLVIGFCYAVPVFADPSESSITSGMGQLIDIAFIIVGLVLGIPGAFLLFQAVQAYGESKQDGGNAQAAGKAYGSLAGGLVLAGAGILIMTIGKNAVKTMLGM